MVRPARGRASAPNSKPRTRRPASAPPAAGRTQEPAPSGAGAPPRAISRRGQDGRAAPPEIAAWFMAHRLREAMRDGSLAPFGGNGGVVEVDETFIGHDRTIKPKGEKKGRGYHHKHKVLSLVDCETKRKRSMVVDDLTAKALTPILPENIAKEARVMTDEAGQYQNLGAELAGRDSVRRGAGEYVSLEDRTIHTNTIEGAFSIFKRGMKGVYQHCGKQHLHRYLAEFDFRYNNRTALGVEDRERVERALRGVVGKRLKYRPAGQPLV